MRLFLLVGILTYHVLIETTVIFGAANLAPPGVDTVPLLEYKNTPRPNELLEQELIFSELNNAEREAIFAHSRGVLDIFEFLKTVDTRAGGYLIGLSRPKEICQSLALLTGLTGMEEAYREIFGEYVDYTDIFLDIITRRGELVVFLVPRQLLTYGKDLPLTAYEFAWFMERPDVRMSNVMFVFGAYELVPDHIFASKYAQYTPDEAAAAMARSFSVLRGPVRTPSSAMRKKQRAYHHSLKLKDPNSVKDAYIVFRQIKPETRILWRDETCHFYRNGVTYRVERVSDTELRLLRDYTTGGHHEVLFSRDQMPELYDKLSVALRSGIQIRMTLSDYIEGHNSSRSIRARDSSLLAPVGVSQTPDVLASELRPPDAVAVPIAAVLGELPVGAYNLCALREYAFREVEDRLVRKGRGRVTEREYVVLTRTRQLIDALRVFGSEHRFGGSILYPASGADIVTPVAASLEHTQLTGAALRIVCVTQERFGTADDVEVFVRSAADIISDLQRDPESALPEYDTVGMYTRIAKSYGLQGIGMIALARLVLFFGAHIDGIYFFSITPDGQMRFFPSLEALSASSAGVHALVRFTLPSEEVSGTYIHISQDLSRLNLGFERCIRSIAGRWDAVLIKGGYDIFNLSRNFNEMTEQQRAEELLRRRVLWRNALQPVIDSNPRAVVIADADVWSTDYRPNLRRDMFRQMPQRCRLGIPVGYGTVFDVTTADGLLTTDDLPPALPTGRTSAHTVSEIQRPLAVSL